MSKYILLRDISMLNRIIAYGYTLVDIFVFIHQMHLFTFLKLIIIIIIIIL